MHPKRLDKSLTGIELQPRWPDSSTRSIPPVPTKWFNSITRASPIECTVGGLVQFNAFHSKQQDGIHVNTILIGWDVVRPNRCWLDASSCGCIHKGIDAARACSWIQGKCLIIWHIVANTRLLQIRSGQVAL